MLILKHYKDLLIATKNGDYSRLTRRLFSSHMAIILVSHDDYSRLDYSRLTGRLFSSHMGIILVSHDYYSHLTGRLFSSYMTIILVSNDINYRLK